MRWKKSACTHFSSIWNNSIKLSSVHWHLVLGWFVDKLIISRRNIPQWIISNWKEGIQVHGPYLGGSYKRVTVMRHAMCTFDLAVRCDSRFHWLQRFSRDKKVSLLKVNSVHWSLYKHWRMKPKSVRPHMDKEPFCRNRWLQAIEQLWLL